jgi:hypothetical protein
MATALTLTPGASKAVFRAERSNSSAPTAIIPNATPKTIHLLALMPRSAKQHHANRPAGERAPMRVGLPSRSRTYDSRSQIGGKKQETFALRSCSFRG